MQVMEERDELGLTKRQRDNFAKSLRGCTVRIRAGKTDRWVEYEQRGSPLEIARGLTNLFGASGKFNQEWQLLDASRKIIFPKREH